MRYLIFALGLLTTAWAQSRFQFNPDNLLFKYGYGIEAYSGTANGLAYFQRSYNSFQLDGYYAVKHRNDVVSVGLNSGIGFSIRPTGLQPDLLLQVPLRVGVRLGALATRYNQQRIGIGLGGGLLGSYARSSFSGSGGSSVTYRSLLYASPDVYADIALNFRNSSIIGRVHLAPLAVTTNVNIKEFGTTNTIRVPAQAQNLGVSLMYAF